MNEEDNPLYPKCTKGESGIADRCLSVTDQCSTTFEMNGTVIHRGCTGDKEVGCFDIGYLTTCNCNRLGHFNDFTLIDLNGHNGFILISIKSSKPLPVAFGQIEIKGGKFLGQQVNIPGLH